MFRLWQQEEDEEEEEAAPDIMDSHLCCPMCSKAWSAGELECVLDREVHLSSCLEQSTSAEVLPCCPMCQQTFTELPQLEQHASDCQGPCAAAAAPAADVADDESSSSSSSRCPVCLISLALLSSTERRVRHIKQCAKECQVLGPRELEENDTSLLSLLIEYSERVEVEAEEENVAPDAIAAPLPLPPRSNLLHYFTPTSSSSSSSTATTALTTKKRAKPSSSSSQFVSAKPWRSCPDYKRIPNSNIVVDAFQYASPELTDTYILSHFHYDHYVGLSAQFDCGTIYCSATTARLLLLSFGSKLSSSRISVITPGKRTLLVPPDTYVTAFDANHCPGALVFVFETTSAIYCHTGDFRATEELARAVKSLATQRMRAVEAVYLDTTYCNAQYAQLPDQRSILDDMERKLDELYYSHSNRQRILLLIGSYTIGKERLALAACKDTKIAVTAQKLKLLRACDEFPAALLADRFTTQRHLSQCWMVTMGQLADAAVKQLLAKHANRFDQVIAIRGTGWVKTLMVQRQEGGSVVSLLVPYSEHSSLGELAQFVRIVNPKQVVPTVFSKGMSKRDMLDLLSY